MKISDVCAVSPDPRSGSISNILVDSDTLLGVELELEGMGGFVSTKLIESRFWAVTNDGSLRDNGIELIMGFHDQSIGMQNISPLKGGDVDKAFEVLRKTFAQSDIVPELSERTSMHVHIDVRELSVEQLVNFILLFTIFEESFFRYSDYSRYTNNYCKPIGCTHDSQVNISNIITSLKEKKSSGHIHEALCGKTSKYESMNIASVNKRGSVEFRLHRGTADVDEIINWVNILLSLKLTATAGKYTPYNLPERVSEYGFKSFLVEVFPLTHHLLEPYISDADVLRGVRIVQDIINMDNYIKLNRNFSRANSGKKAKEEGIMYEFAKKHDREIYLEGED